MKPEHITDDLEKLLELLPLEVQETLSNPQSHEDLLEIVLDLGRLPEARYPDRVITLGEKFLSRSDLQTTVNRLTNFGSDNRAGIERTLHRISAIRNRQKDVVGLTCRVGRAVFGTVAMVRDLIEEGQSLLLMGRPGVGKTTVLREIARVMADDLHRRVVIIDTSNEIAGDGDIPHPAIGRARRMQVRRPELQHQVMIEAVENHMPEVIVIDEIGTELETHAARTIAERGVQLIATAHGNALANLIKNPSLSDLVGGIQSVTLGDEEARRRKTQKTVLERAADPTFPVAVEINSRIRWNIHKDVATTVDSLLRGQPPCLQVRVLESDGTVKLLDTKNMPSSTTRPSPKYLNISEPNNSFLEKDSSNLHLSNKKIQSELSLQKGQENKPLKVLCCGISHQLFDEAIRRHNWPASWVKNLKEADVVLSIRNGLSQNQSIRRNARESQIPIHVIKTNTLHQIERAIERLLQRSEFSSNQQLPNSPLSLITDREDALAALEECRLALEKVVIPLGRPVELVPRSEKILKMQADLVTRYRLRSDVFGHADHQRIRIYPP